MNKRFLSLMMLSFLCHQASALELNVYLWEDTIAPSVLETWHKQTGVSVNLYHFDNDDERSLLMLKSVQLPFDIMVLDNVSAFIFSRQNAFEDLTALSNRSNNDPMWLQACGTHAIPYFWGAVGIAYRKSLFDKPPTQWSEVIEIAPQHRGHVGMLKDSVETLLPALYMLKASPITESIDTLKHAYQLLESANPNILTYEYVLSYVRSHPQTDNLHMAVAYSGDHYSLNRFFNHQDWDFTVPDGRPYLWVDCMAVNTSSPNPDQAKAFLNFLMTPEIAALNAEYIRAASPNYKARALLPEEHREDGSIYLPEQRLSEGIIDSELSAKNLSLRAKIISSVTHQYEAKP
ncbi:polyamine ABC transporter substrate-binding protein [Vibrio metoecus]|uniref:Norspermidine sensor n=1 Tax=Vibrio metoecus TaxID=1481663 RepID=A0A271VUM0_VIBMT|nr:spermidine/putrescine ABC transporter substrate-binding protein [Vibrio metoecus]KQB10655.1 Norspermidine sensor [Vibrio metoecus]PAR21858.1 Norspermidine sensor [Vibrio metoecus]PAR24963.1 Norspermidine sensor [Vibrio metoecus]